METLDLSSLFGGGYSGRRVLVTGHTGFKGSWLTYWLTSLGAEVGGLALDPERAGSHWDLLGLDLGLDARVDLCDADAVRNVVQRFKPDIIFHLAAQALVRRSYRDPARTFMVNVGGLVNLLEAVRDTPSVIAVVNATTDKVYESPPPRDGYDERAPLGGHDPYSASKACAELVSMSYRRSFFVTGEVSTRPVRLATARAGNVIGGGDWAEDRLVPDLMRAARDSTRLELRNPRATRPWQHVLEPLSGYLLLGDKLLQGRDVDEAWNFGPVSDSSIAVGDVIARVRHRWPDLEVVHDNGAHPYEAGKLQLDCSKAQERLGWHPVWNADTTLGRTVDWYIEFNRTGKLLTGDDLSAYVADARASGQAWTS